MEKAKIALKDIFFGSAKNSRVEFIRSLFVGGVAFVADSLLMVLLKEMGGMGAVAAAAVSFVLGVVVNYLLSNYWAFKESNVKNPVRRFIIFTVIAMVGLVMTVLIVDLFDGPFAANVVFGELINPAYYYTVGKVVATAVVFFWNFFSRKLILYRRSNTV